MGIGAWDTRWTAPARLAQERRRAIRQRRRLAPLGLTDPARGFHAPLAAGQPSVWPRGDDPRILVIAHVYYPELWPQLARVITRLPGTALLYVTLAHESAGHLTGDIRSRFPAAEVEPMPNRGRDMWPFLQSLAAVDLRDADLVLKLHTKASAHRLDGVRWRTRILDSLVPDPPGLARLLELLRIDPSIGVVAGEGCLLGKEFWGGNAAQIQELAARAAIRVEPESTLFPGGSMFWARPEVLEPLVSLGLGAPDFPVEPLPIDATLPHALERFIGVLAHAHGRVVLGADEVPARLAQVQGRAHGR